MPRGFLRFTAEVTDPDGEVLILKRFDTVEELADWLGVSASYARIMFAAGQGVFRRSRTDEKGVTQTCACSRSTRIPQFEE